MDLLVVLGTSTAYGYSLLALLANCAFPPPLNMDHMGGGGGHHGGMDMNGGDHQR